MRARDAPQPSRWFARLPVEPCAFPNDKSHARPRPQFWGKMFDRVASAYKFVKRAQRSGFQIEQVLTLNAATERAQP